MPGRKKGDNYLVEKRRREGGLLQEIENGKADLEVFQQKPRALRFL